MLACLAHGGCLVLATTSGWLCFRPHPLPAYYHHHHHYHHQLTSTNKRKLNGKKLQQNLETLIQSQTTEASRQRRKAPRWSLVVLLTSQCRDIGSSFRWPVVSPLTTFAWFVDQTFGGKLACLGRVVIIISDMLSTEELVKNSESLSLYNVWTRKKVIGSSAQGLKQSRRSRRGR